MYSFTLIHVLLFFSCLDNCNSLFRLQLVQNAAARLLTCYNRRHQITPIQPFPHWLPICFRIDFNILLIGFKLSTENPMTACIQRYKSKGNPSLSIRASQLLSHFLKPIFRLAFEGNPVLFFW